MGITRQEAIALLSGILFGAGLAISQMTNPAKVLAFLDVTGRWDPSLAFVMGTALLIAALGHALHRRRSRAGSTPAAQSTASAAGSSRLDGRLLGGSALFGVGWGLAGFCPGPAIASLVTGSPAVLLFVAAMLAGMGLYRALEARSSATTQRAS